MTRKAKAFDCVEMKNRIQAERLAEYRAQKDEFPSYIAFVNARVRNSELARTVRQKARSAPPKEDV
jgi:hypothetical protein